MNYQQTLANQVRWTARNLAYNLDFLPADKLGWKPVPTVPSSLEIVNHLCAGMLAAQKLFADGKWHEESEAQFERATDLASAKALLQSVPFAFADALEAIPNADLENIIETPFGTMPLFHVVQFEPVDIVHHHGQIAFIQQMLGDTQSHFAPPEA